MRIVLLGTGNLATRLGIALHAKHAEIVQVYGRTESKVFKLANILGCTAACSLSEITQEADLYLITLSENVIPGIFSGISFGDSLVVHTSGSLPLEILSSISKNYGVFYPLQTLSSQKEIDFSTVPICIEANSSQNLTKLTEIAKLISSEVHHIDSIQRRQLHLAAVFVCNFVNHFYAIGESLLHEQDLDFNLLKPLIAETAKKALLLSPSEVQTGPAVRDNQKIMELHRKMLEQHPEWQRLYALISKDIISTYS
jgi:predicted short-subunit dehydrogenase-like oxidoreductase (DUF2520 family)